MFNKIRSLMGGTGEESSQQDAFQQLNAVAPLKPQHKEKQPGEAKEEPSFVCREAVLDRAERIAGYEFALGRELQSRMLANSALIRRVYDDAMLRNLAPLGVSSLLGKRLAFIRLSLASLKNPQLKSFSNLNTVVMITPGTINASDIGEVRANLQHLNHLGIMHGWSIDRPRPELAEFLHVADFIEIDASALDGIQLKTICMDFRTHQAKQKLIASKLQTSDDFNLCFHCGFHFFKGPFITSRENWRPAKSEINRLRVFDALNLIRAGAESDVIADCLRTDPVLTFKLLRYINSPGIGLRHKVNELSQALLVMGRDRFYRWLSLLLFDFNQPGYRELVLNEQSLTRARFMEMIAGQGKVPDLSDQLFITGLFSLLDVMIGQPLNDVLKQVSLPDAIVAALKGEAGPMRDALLLGIAVESSNAEELATASAQCGLEAATVAGLMLEALSWSQQVISAGEQK